ncbi:MAG: S1 RNA-binding domain-containing protein [Lachnospiraceae bacterium]|nr:S1 RNA-binding domain-containing protein [Lachnospiraceae bacterium]
MEKKEMLEQEENMEVKTEQPQEKETNEETDVEAVDPAMEEEESPNEAVTEEDVLKTEMPVKKATLTQKDAEEFEKQATLEDAFLRRSITLPGRRKQKAAFKDEEVIIGDEGGEINTFGSLKKKEYEMLAASAKASKPKVLYGRIDGIEEMEVGKIRVPIAVCHLITDKRIDINTDNEMTSGIYKIQIPAPMLFIYNQEEFETPEGYDTLKKKMDMRVGSIVEFVVYDINMDDEVVLASRIRAMQILSYDYYLGKKAQIKPGVKAKGYITYVNASGVCVDVFGAECFISHSELSWKYIKNPLNERKHFYVGAPVPVRIKSVESARASIYGREYPYIKITGSIKDAKDNPNKMFFEKYVIRQKYAGEIGYVLTTGEYIVNLGSSGDGIDGCRATCMCKAPAIELGGTPYVGQKCMVAITNKDEKDYRLIGAFTYLESE